MKKYKVLKKYPKSIMNSGRMVELTPGSVVHLKYERQLDRLISLGYIKEIIELKRKSPLKEQAKKSTETKLIQPRKPKAKNYVQPLEDNTGE